LTFAGVLELLFDAALEPALSFVGERREVGLVSEADLAPLVLQ
jgi:hypothetical protein